MQDVCSLSPVYPYPKTSTHILGLGGEFKEYLVSQVLLQSKNCEEQDPLRIIEFTYLL